MSDLAAMSTIADVDKLEMPDVTYVVRRARQALTEGGSPRRARDILLAAFGTFGRATDLLWALAEVEFADGDVAAGREAMKEALALDLPSPVSAVRQLRILGGSGCWREAVVTTRGIPESMRQEPLLRMEAGKFYRFCRCPGHAVAAFGKPKDLPWHGRVTWLSSWLLSGGPVHSLRQQVLSWEAKALQELLEPPMHVEAISTVSGLDPRHMLRVRTQLETYNFRMARIFYHAIAIRRMAFRSLPLVAIPVWLCLLLYVSTLNFITYPLDLPEFTAVSTVIGIVPVLAVSRLWFDSNGRARASRVKMVTHLTMIMVGETAIIAALSRPTLPHYGWYSATTLGLMSGPLLLAFVYLGITVDDIYNDRLIRRIVRADPTLSVTDQLLITLTGLQFSSGYHGMHERRFHARLLEWAARTLSQYLLSRSSAKFLGSGDWLAQRVAGWAQALRYMQRQVIAPVPGSQSKVEAFLTHEIRCLASGDLGALTWREPPLGESRRATLQRRVVSTARAVVVVALPLGAVLAAHSLLHFSAALFNWGRVLTVSWALLYVLLSIDPTIRDKVSVAKDLADLARPPR